MCGVAVVVIAPCGCHSRGHCAAWASRLRLLCRVGVVVTVVALHGVSQLWLLCHVSVAIAVIMPCGCHCRGHCTTCGITVAVIVSHVASRLLSLSHMWHHGRGHCTMYGIAVEERGWPHICRQGRWKVGEHCIVRWKREYWRN